MEVLIGALLEKGLITQAQLDEAKEKQIGAKKPLDELVVEMGFVNETDLVNMTSDIFSMPVFNLKDQSIDKAVIDLIPYETARRYGIFPVCMKNDRLILAMSDPTATTECEDVMVIDDIRSKINRQVEPVLSNRKDIVVFIDRFYKGNDDIYDILKNIEENPTVKVVSSKLKKDEEIIDIDAYEDNPSPIIRIVNVILNDAVKMRASDVHIEPQEKTVKVRYRIDGSLKNIMEIPMEAHANLAARIKILSQLDIIETRQPQDGRITIIINKRRIDLRVSIIPTFFGEKIVLRLLDPSQTKVSLDDVGFSPAELEVFTQEIVKPQGMILVTGPTGSGKTSTLYATLNYIKSESINITTVEDPIEYLMDGINQIQVNLKKDVSFANSLRSILRQDPNVVLVGEIRDRETVDIAFRASLTGHLVFSTLHTNDSVSTITRLLDIGMEPYLISSSLILIVAQRLVRVICSHCKEEYFPKEETLDKFKEYSDKIISKKFYHGKGCQECQYTGYYGRTAIFEIFIITKTIKEMIANEASQMAILKQAKTEGLKTLIDSGIDKVCADVTTLEEITSVVGIEKEDIEKEDRKSKVKKILVADDEAVTLKLVSTHLRKAGYEVIEAVNGQEVLDSAAREKPDLIVTDVMMPLMDGFETVKRLRSRLETAVIPIIMLTAESNIESETKGLDVGADDYIVKPFNADRLIARVKMLLSKRCKK